MIAFGRLPARIAALFAVLLMALAAPAFAQQNHIAAKLVVEGPAKPGEQLMVAIAFDPEPGWHGYWANPGDAGFGMSLDWNLPVGWKAGEPLYPAPQKLTIAGLMNHVYEGPYAVLVPIETPEGASVANPAELAVDAQWLACTDKICVPERARLTATTPDAGSAAQAEQFNAWRASIAPLLDRSASFELEGERLRVAIPLPASLDLGGETHLFVENAGLVDYAAVQTFSRDGNLLIVEIPLRPNAEAPDELRAILSLGDGNGVRLVAEPGPVPADGVPLKVGSESLPPYYLLALGALAGGLLLNVLPCVFPILSLKALSLVRAGRSETEARREGLFYTVGVVLACLALGATVLLLRSAGEQVGWAFQLQEPGVVVALLVLATAITANLTGLYHIPQFAFSRGAKPLGSFATGLLAAFIATPCTGPFMAAALGASLLLPPLEALVLFGALGLGLALPFLLLGFVPALRRLLPRPGPWMEHFRRLMAIPMALTALALAWLCWRMGGAGFAIAGLLFAAIIVLAIRAGAVARPARLAKTIGFVALAALAAAFLPVLFETRQVKAGTELIAAQPFSEERLAEARASGNPVFVYFTADWCLTCKVNEQVAIEREATRDAFEQAEVVVLRGDWTRRDPEITRYLTRRGMAGVPLYVWYDPGQDGRVLPQVLTPDTLIEAARAVPEQIPPPRSAT